MVSFRDDSGFRFRMVDASGNSLLTSIAFSDGRSAGHTSKALQNGELQLELHDNQVQAVHNNQAVAHSQPCTDSASAQQLLQQINDALVNI